MRGIKLVQLDRRDLKDAAASQSVGSAVPFEELKEQVAQQVDEFRSVKRARLAAERGEADMAYQCELCSKTFKTALGLRNHMQWHTEKMDEEDSDDSDEGVAKLIQRRFAGTVDARVLVADGGQVRLYLLVNGRSRAQIDDEAAQQRREFEAAQAARAAEKLERCREASRLADQRLRARERAAAEEEAEEAGAEEPPSEQRRGSTRRRSYCPKEQLKILIFLDEVKKDSTITRKVEFFEGDARSRGARWCNVANQWAKPEKRRAIEKAAAQQHASSLLRIDKESRKKGKYLGMERNLYAKYRERRARGRKCSPKWFVHTARYIMRTEYPNDAANFKGSNGWRRRFCSRFTIVRRKKTNVKNKTWEETKPRLQRYFAALRRRLRDSDWRTRTLALQREVCAAAVECARNAPPQGSPTRAAPAGAAGSGG